MENYGEFFDARNSVMVQFHDVLPLSYLEGRMDHILSDTGTYDPDEIVLHVDLGCIPGTTSYGVIRTKRGRIFELHVLVHPASIDRAFLNANGKTKTPTHPADSTLH